MDPQLHPAGTRVRITGNWEWPDGTTGTIDFYPGVARELASEPPGSETDFLAAGLARLNKGRKGDIITQWVRFDEPTDDGSGDGPYGGGEIDIQNLTAISSSEVEGSE